LVLVEKASFSKEFRSEFYSGGGGEPISDFSCGRNTSFSGSHHCAAVLFSQVPKKCTDLDLSLLYILTLGTFSKFTRKNNIPSAQRLLFAALFGRWPQVCRVKITFTVLPTNCFVCTTKKSMKYVVNWIPLRIRVREIHNPILIMKAPH